MSNRFTKEVAVMWRVMAAAALLTSGLAYGQVPADGESPVVPAAVDPAKDPVSIDFHFDKGDTFELELTKSSRTGGRKATPIRSFVDVEILDVTDDGEATIGWTQRMPQTLRDFVDAAATPSELQTAALLQAADGMRFEFVLDWSGEIQEIKNFEAVQERMGKIFDAMEEGIRARGKSAEEVAKAMAAVRDLFADEERAMPLLLREPAAYFQAYGFEFPPGEPLAYEVELPNPWGGPVFPGEMKVELVDYNPNAAKVRISGVQTIDREEGRAALIETLKAMADRAGKPMPENDEEALTKTDLTMDNAFSYRYDRVSGLIELAKITTSVKFGDKTKVEVVQMKVTKSAKARVEAPATPATSP